MTTVCLTLEYDGTDFCGWQVQPGCRTVQEEVERALQVLLKHPVRVHASGRTDAGVHALGQVVHFQTPMRLPVKAYLKGLRGLLPDDVAVVAAREVPDTFHARFSAQGKHYRYRLRLSDVPHPLAARTCWVLPGPLDIGRMRRAARHFVGEHDFAAFCASGSDVKSTVRRIDRLDVASTGDEIVIDIEGSGFLRNMVRIMVGTLVEIGRSEREEQTLPHLLSGQSRSQAGPTAPPQGLCLVHVSYPDELLS
ncbi:MAG: tRNA pseudouridine(38-40) synthase TruA [Deltaproteobacteria bacterium]|nr:MAG: tRNA pseudouridine(38-40) synthase TruA [Deltaproteobacteria bacterium]